MSDAPFWKADPRVWPTIVSLLQGEWPREVVDEDLRWHADQIRRGYLEALPSRRALMLRWSWTERRVRNRLRELGPVPHQGPNKVPTRSQQGPNKVPSADGGTDTMDPDCPNKVPTRSQQGPNKVPEGSTRALVPETRDQRPETRVYEQPPPAAPPPAEEDDPADAALPRWSASAHREARRGGYRGTRAELVQGVADCLEAITGKPGCSATGAKEVTRLWRALEYPPFGQFVANVRLVADAAHRSPAALFARDVRAEGWPEGTNREYDPATICRHSRWDARLAVAGGWDAMGRPSKVAPALAEVQGEGAATPLGEDEARLLGLVPGEAARVALVREALGWAIEVNGQRGSWAGLEPGEVVDVLDLLETCAPGVEPSDREAALRELQLDRSRRRGREPGAWRT